MCVWRSLPMTPIAICSRKGGSAKTTLACELATLSQGLIVDLDTQASATTFWKKRKAELPRCVSGGDSRKLSSLMETGEGHAGTVNLSAEDRQGWAVASPT